MLSMIFACDEDGAIGKDGDLPWRQSSDLQFFKQTTLNKTVVMGRKTWQSIGRPLPNRRNIVMTRDDEFAETERMGFEQVLELAQNEEVVIIGGGEIYALFLEHTKELYRTVVHTRVEDADTFAPEFAHLGFHLLTERFVAAGPKDDHAMTFQHWIV
ncbi:MAG: dihydrofolate reductase [archaeon]|nr:dihydrofolate reductase [archaeon]